MLDDYSTMSRPQDPWQTRVDTHREFLKHHLCVDDTLLNSLMEKRLESGTFLLTQIEKEDNIESSAPTNLAKVDALVKVLRFKGPKEETFNLLCRSLYEIGRVWIVQELMGQKRGHSDESDSKQGASEGKSTLKEPEGWKDRLTTAYDARYAQSSKQDYSKAAVADSRGAALEAQIVEDRHIKALEFEIFSNTDELVSFGEALMRWSHKRTLNYFSDMKGSKVNYQFSSLLHAWVDKEDAPTIEKLLSAFKKVEKEGAARRILTETKK